MRHDASVASYRPDRRHLRELRALAVAEVETDRLLTQRVIAARTAGVTWEEIGEAVGIATTTAWRRWHLATRDQPDPKRRSGQPRPRLDDNDDRDLSPTQAAVQTILNVLAEPHDMRWSNEEPGTAVFSLPARGLTLECDVIWVSAVEGSSPPAHPTGHARTRWVGGDSAGEQTEAGLTEATVRAVLDGLGETYEVQRPLEGYDVEFKLARRRLTMACSGVRVTVNHWPVKEK